MVTTAARRRSADASAAYWWTRGVHPQGEGPKRQDPRPRRVKGATESARAETPRLSRLWVDAGYRGRGKEWVERSLGLSADVVHRSPKPPPEKVLLAWAREWHEEGRNIDAEKMFPRRGLEVLPRRWVAERTFTWLCHNRRMGRNHERLCSTGEALDKLLVSDDVVTDLLPYQVEEDACLSQGRGPRFLTYLTLPCIVLLCTIRCEFISDVRNHGDQ